MKNQVTKKLLTLVMASVLSAGVLAGCGSSDAETAVNSEEAVTETAQAADSVAETETESTQETEAAEVEDKGTITVAASATPHAEILEQAAPIIAEQGWTLEVTVFDEYIMPNNVVESEEFDANYFQHIPYIESFNEEQGTHLVNAGGIHYEPFGIYPGTKSDLSELADGDTIAVPNDTTNEARALLLLEANGVLTLREGAGLEATVNDIESQSVNVEILEIEAAQVARVKDEVAFVVLNGN